MGQPSVAEVLARAAQRTERVAVSTLELIDAARAERDEQLPRRAGA